MRRMKRIQEILDIQGDNINTKRKGRNGYKLNKIWKNVTGGNDIL